MSKEKQTEETTEEMNQSSNSFNEDEDIENFEEGNNYNYKEEEEEYKEAKGLNEEDIALTVASMTSQFIPDPYKEQYTAMYVQTTVPVLKLLDFEDLTAGADLSSLPGPVRAVLAVVGIAGPAVAGIYLYNQKGGA